MDTFFPYLQLYCDNLKVNVLYGAEPLMFIGRGGIKVH